MLNVLRAVGDTAERVSSLRLVEPLPPNKVGVWVVFKVSFGRLDTAGLGGSGAGVEASVWWIGAEGRMARDIVLAGPEDW